MSGASERVCPISRCAELNPVDAIVCHQCGTRLVPDQRTLDRWMRVRAASQWGSVDVDLDEHADMIVRTVEGLRLSGDAPGEENRNERTPAARRVSSLPKGRPAHLIDGTPLTTRR